MSSSHALLLARDPRADAGIENSERNRAGAEDLVVERAHVERITQLVRGEVAQLANLELSDLVREGLPRPRDVAIDLDGDVVQGLAAVRREVVEDRKSV